MAWKRINLSEEKVTPKNLIYFVQNYIMKHDWTEPGLILNSHFGFRV